MFVDIMMALVIALFLEYVALTSKAFKQIIILTGCIFIIVIYFIDGCNLDFIGKMNFGVWLVFVILFNKIVMFGINKLKKYKILLKNHR